MKPQIIKLSDAEYFARSEMSKHSLDEFAKNPYAFFERRKAGIHADEDTDALRIGRVVHTAVLEPFRFAHEYVLQPEHIKIRRGKDWDAFKFENEGREIIKADESFLAKGIAAAIEKNETARKLINACVVRESAIIWRESKDDDYEIPMRAKVDFMSPNLAVLGDLKTTTDASPEAFMKDCDTFGYDIQAAVYISAARALGRDPKCFAFLVVEKTYPFTTAIYTFDADSDFVLAGDLEYRRRLKAYADYSRGSFEGKELFCGWKEHNLSLPPWSKRLANLKDNLISQVQE